MAVEFGMDFSPIGKLGEIYQQAQQRQQLQEGLQKMGLPGNMGLANLALQQQEHARQQANTDRSFGLQERQFTAGIEGAKVPAGFRATPAGGLAPVPGGPEDPAYIKLKTDATDKGRPMSITDITKLTEEGQKYSDLTRFSDTFKDNFAGFQSSKVGTIANVMGRHLPEAVVGKDMAEQAGWWQGYDRYKNVVRHELYGAALTKPETAAFESADITPGMQPDQIRKNLALQKSIVETGLKRKASAMVEAGYNPKVIGASFGVDLGSMGVGTTKGGAAPAAPGAPTPQPQPGTAAPSEAAVSALRSQPARRAEFDAKYGAGASARILGGP